MLPRTQAHYLVNYGKGATDDPTNGDTARSSCVVHHKLPNQSVRVHLMFSRNDRSTARVNQQLR
jgi:hypothetical protein